MKCPRCKTELTETNFGSGFRKDGLPAGLMNAMHLMCGGKCFTDGSNGYYYLYLPHNNTLYRHMKYKWYKIGIQKERVMFT